MRRVKKYRLPESFKKSKKEFKKSGVHRRRGGKIYSINFSDEGSSVTPESDKGFQRHTVLGV